MAAYTAYTPVDRIVNPNESNQSDSRHAHAAHHAGQALQQSCAWKTFAFAYTHEFRDLFLGDLSRNSDLFH